MTTEEYLDRLNASVRALAVAIELLNDWVERHEQQLRKMTGVPDLD